jgi:hypothetical protein
MVFMYCTPYSTTLKNMLEYQESDRSVFSE